MKSSNWMLPLALGLYTASAVVSGAVPSSPDGPAPADAPGAMLRAAARPLALPAVWARLGDAAQAGDPHRALAAARALHELWPAWVDAEVHVAWLLAFDLAGEATAPEDRLDLVLRAVGALEQGAEERLEAGQTDAAARLLCTAAVLVEDRARQLPGLDEALRSRLGRAPAEIAAELISTAADLFGDDEVHRARLAFVTMRTIASALRVGDLERAETTRLLVLEQMESLAGQRDDAAEAAAALRRLGDLHGLADDADRRAALAGDPWLADLLEAFADRPRGGR